MCYMKTEPPGINLSKTFPCVVAALSFAVWVFALGGPFSAQWPELMLKPVFGSILLILHNANNSCSGKDLLRHDSSTVIFAPESF